MILGITKSQAERAERQRQDGAHTPVEAQEVGRHVLRYNTEVSVAPTALAAAPNLRPDDAMAITDAWSEAHALLESEDNRPHDSIAS